MADVPQLPQILRDIDADLVDRWTISDDLDRGQVIESASSADLRRLVQAVDLQVLRAIDRYLDRFDGHEPGEVTWLHDVAQASLEAKLELDRRRGVG